MKSKLEYIWLDGYKPTQSLRSKTMVRSDFGGTLEECPMWSFDGSSTLQAEGNASDCLLKPVAIIPDPGRTSAYLVMTEVLNADGTPHESNGRATIEDDDDDFWFGFEQEYFLFQDGRPLGWPEQGFAEFSDRIKSLAALDVGTAALIFLAAAMLPAALERRRAWDVLLAGAALAVLSGVGMLRLRTPFAQGGFELAHLHEGVPVERREQELQALVDEKRAELERCVRAPDCKNNRLLYPTIPLLSATR